MSPTAGPRWVLQGLALAVIVLVAFLAGMLVERLQSHAQRDDMLRRYDRALQEHRSLIMESEKWQESGTARR
jgi:type II secretory pathway pseudopilin PulG